MAMCLGDFKGHDPCQAGYIPVFWLQHMETTYLIAKIRVIGQKGGEADAAKNVERLGEVIWLLFSNYEALSVRHFSPDLSVDSTEMSSQTKVLTCTFS
jgi:hypothetical protein